MKAMCPHKQGPVLTQHGCMQLSTKLKVGVMWDHNGTYMEGFGFQYRNHQITVEITQDDKITGESPAPIGRALPQDTHYAKRDMHYAKHMSALIARQ